MKKIIFTVTNDLNYDQRMIRIGEVLVKEGFDVLLVGRSKKDSPPLLHKSFRQKRLYCFFQKGKLFYIEYNIRLFFYLLFVSADVIGAIDLDTITPCYYAAKWRGKKLVYDAHEYFPEVIEVVRRPAVKKVWEKVEGMFVPRVDFAYTVNESLKDIFEQKYGKPFRVIRNVPLLEEFPIQVKKEKYIIYAGVVNEGRGLEELVQAMKHINCKLYICGHGDIYHKLVHLVQELHLTEKVRFYGSVPPSELKLIIRDAYMGFLLLRNSGLSYYYSLANKFFDYMHAGIPQITINFPEYRAINSRYEVAELIELDVEAIVSTANKLLNDEERYRQLSQNALAASKEYNWQKESQKLTAYYKELLK